MNNQTQGGQPQAQTPTNAPKKSNMTLIIILIVVFSVIILGVGGYFAWKYFVKAKTTTADVANKSGTISLKDLETTFKYPTGTIVRSDRSKDASAKSQIDYETADSLNTVYNYYINLAAQKKLTVSHKALETDGSTGSITIEGSGYKVDVYLYKYEKTEFSLYFYGDNIKDDTATSATSTTTPTTTGSTNTSKTAITTDYVIADSDTRVITNADLVNLTPWQLKIARNEIYARHGREFAHKDMICYFGAKSWYTVNPNYSSGDLTTIDNQNVATILAYEKSSGSTIIDVDTGGC
jgi:hypothetical protein